MGDTKNIIEINGKQYDAFTGKIIGSAGSQPVSKTVDGFVRRKSSTGKPHRLAPTPVKASSVHQKQQRPATLMRSAVPKPKTTPRHPASTDLALSTANMASTPRVDQSRFARAKQVAKSSLVSHFGSKTHASSSSTEEIHRQLKKTDKHRRTEQPNSQKPAKLDGRKTPLEHKLHKAVASATAHQQAPYQYKKKRQSLAEKLNISKRAMNMGLFAFSFLALGSFIAYQNVPNLSMRLAVARSGVNGSLPAYKPSGYSLNGPIYYQPGQITIAYKSNSDDRKFNVVQKSSGWNNEVLLEKFVSSLGRSYQTFQETGKTIYIYDGGNASWIKDGVWYEVQGTSSLSQDQLLKLANSL